MALPESGGCSPQPLARTPMNMLESIKNIKLVAIRQVLSSSNCTKNPFSAGAPRGIPTDVAYDAHPDPWLAKECALPPHTFRPRRLWSLDLGASVIKY